MSNLEDLLHNAEGRVRWVSDSLYSLLEALVGDVKPEEHTCDEFQAKSLHEHHGMQYVGWVVVCSKCSQKGYAIHGKERQSLAFRSLLEQGWYVDWDEGVIQIMDAAFWLCPECHNPIGTMLKKKRIAESEKEA